MCQEITASFGLSHPFRFILLAHRQTNASRTFPAVYEEIDASLAYMATCVLFGRLDVVTIYRLIHWNFGIYGVRISAKLDYVEFK